ncbi:hypothetical protein AAHB37_13745 [Glutamicibacter halophytocola]
METELGLKRRARKINRVLAETYPYAVPELDFENPFQLLVATVLSAQTTDVRVNAITPALFARFPDALAMSQAERGEVEELIRPTGFFRAKTDSLLGLSAALVQRHDGQVPPKLGGIGQAARGRAQNRKRGAGQRLRGSGDHRRHPLRTPGQPLWMDR